MSVSESSLAPPPAPPPPPDPATARPIVEVQNVTKAFGDVVAVSDVSFTVGPGVTSLLGPNGAGQVDAVSHPVRPHGPVAGHGEGSQ